jgi:uncharacterized protein with FMN-binding domain
MGHPSAFELAKYVSTGDPRSLISYSVPAVASYVIGASSTKVTVYTNSAHTSATAFYAIIMALNTALLQLHPP